MSKTQNTAVRLYSPGLITIATLLGSPVAGCILLSHNYRALGRHTVARQVLFWGSVGSALLIVAAYFLPDNFPKMVLPIGYTIGMREAVKQMHGTEYISHITKGGAKASSLMAVGVGVACLCAILGIIFLVLLALPQ